MKPQASPGVDINSLKELAEATEQIAKSSKTTGRQTTIIIVLTVLSVIIGFIAILPLLNSKLAQDLKNKTNNNHPSSQNEVPKKQDNLFEKNQECSKYKNEIVDKLEKESTNQKNSVFDEIFYSPLLNTCIYSFTTFYDDKTKKPLLNGLPNINAIEHTIINQFTNERILNTYSKIDGAERTNTDLEFYNKINELKK